MSNLTQKQAENCLTLIEVLKEVKDEDYDSHNDSSLSHACCALGHAARHVELFHRSSTKNSTGMLREDFGNRFYDNVFTPVNCPDRKTAVKNLKMIIAESNWMDGGWI